MLPLHHQAGLTGLPLPRGFPPYLASSPLCSQGPVLPGAGLRVCLPEKPVSVLSFSCRSLSQCCPSPDGGGGGAAGGRGAGNEAVDSAVSASSGTGLRARQEPEPLPSSSSSGLRFSGSLLSPSPCVGAPTLRLQGALLFSAPHSSTGFGSERAHCGGLWGCAGVSPSLRDRPPEDLLSSPRGVAASAREGFSAPAATGRVSALSPGQQLLALLEASSVASPAAQAGALSSACSLTSALTVQSLKD